MLNVSVKSLLTMLLTGIMIGLIISPFIESKPQNIIKIPLSSTYAQTAEEKTATSLLPKTNTILTYFEKFDEEQKQYKASKILGVKTSKITIAVVGDSMVDTMGTNLPYLDKAFKEFLPDKQFSLFNYGIGSQNIEEAIKRIDTSYEYKDRNYPSIDKIQADFIIVESFAYNPLGNETDNLDAYKKSLKTLIQKLKTNNKPVIFLATLCRLKATFGKGPGGVNWDNQTSVNHAATIQTYLETGLSVAKEMNIPIIDIYHETIQLSGEGIPEYVSSHDGIHPSEAGHQFIAKTIAKKMVEMGLR